MEPLLLSKTLLKLRISILTPKDVSSSLTPLTFPLLIFMLTLELTLLAASKEKTSSLKLFQTCCWKRKAAGIVVGDWNCVTAKLDCTANFEAKDSPNLRRLISVMNLQDSYRILYPRVQHFSRYYSRASNEGATRIDRSYHYGDTHPISARYIPIGFSDHLCLVVTFSVPSQVSPPKCPHSRSFFKIPPSVVNDKTFKSL